MEICLFIMVCAPIPTLEGTNHLSLSVYKSPSYAGESHRSGDEFHYEFMITSLKETFTMTSQFYYISLINDNCRNSLLLSNFLSFSLTWMRTPTLSSTLWENRSLRLETSLSMEIFPDLPLYCNLLYYNKKSFRFLNRLIFPHMLWIPSYHSL